MDNKNQDKDESHRVEIMKNITGTTVLFECVMEHQRKECTTVDDPLSDGEIIQVMELALEFQLNELASFDKKKISGLQKELLDAKEKPVFVLVGFAEELDELANSAIHLIGSYESFLSNTTKEWQELIQRKLCNSEPRYMSVAVQIQQRLGETLERTDGRDLLNRVREKINHVKYRVVLANGILGPVGFGRTMQSIALVGAGALE